MPKHQPIKTPPGPRNPADRPRRRLPVGWIIIAVWILLFAAIAAMLAALWSGGREALERTPPTDPPPSAQPR